MGSGPQQTLSLIPREERGQRSQEMGLDVRGGWGRVLVPLGWLTIHHISFLHVPLGCSTLQTGSSWFRTHNCHLQNRVVVS